MSKKCKFDQQWEQALSLINPDDAAKAKVIIENYQTTGVMPTDMEPKYEMILLLVQPMIDRRRRAADRARIRRQQQKQQLPEVHPQPESTPEPAPTIAQPQTESQPQTQFRPKSMPQLPDATVQGSPQTSDHRKQRWFRQAKKRRLKQQSLRQKEKGSTKPRN